MYYNLILKSSFDWCQTPGKFEMLPATDASLAGRFQ